MFLTSNDIYKKITDRYFCAHFQEILLIFGFIAKNNIKLVIGMNTKVIKPFFTIHEEFDLDILVGFNCIKNPV